MKNILVTGGAGFIGSNFIKLMLNKYKDIRIVNLDILTYAGNLANLSEVKSNSKYIFVRGNICDKLLVNKLFDQYDFTYVVNFAAESHVDRSIESPEVFLNTNILGTQILLEAAKNKWSKTPGDKFCREYKDNVKFVQISTDEVYGSLGKEGSFHEKSLIQPNSPYSASKASADLFVRSYIKTYGFPANITRCSNNYGPNQFPEKLIPLIISNCLENKSLPIYGDGKQVRDWLHVYDHCEAIDCVLQKGIRGEVYNIGGNNEIENINIVKLIIHHLNKSEDLIRYVKDRPGHDKRYAIDNTKISLELGWAPKYTFNKGIEETIDWYLNNINWIKDIVSGNYMNYYKHMYELI